MLTERKLFCGTVAIDMPPVATKLANVLQLMEAEDS